MGIHQYANHTVQLQQLQYFHWHKADLNPIVLSGHKRLSASGIHHHRNRRFVFTSEYSHCHFWGGCFHGEGRHGRRLRWWADGRRRANDSDARGTWIRRTRTTPCVRSKANGDDDDTPNDGSLNTTTETTVLLPPGSERITSRVDKAFRFIVDGKYYGVDSTSKSSHDGRLFRRNGGRTPLPARATERPIRRRRRRHFGAEHPPDDKTPRGTGNVIRARGHAGARILPRRVVALSPTEARETGRPCAPRVPKPSTGTLLWGRFTRLRRPGPRSDDSSTGTVGGPQVTYL